MSTLNNLLKLFISMETNLKEAAMSNVSLTREFSTRQNSYCYANNELN